MMNKLRYILGAATLLPFATTAMASDRDKPNILIIFTDDQGYADFSCMGSETNHTPVFDKLAEGGTVFTEFYAQHVSGASRAALLTGRYPLRSGARSLPASEVTFAEMAQSAGYQTACIGKWDVSSRKEIIERMPNAQGFDYYYGTLGANDSGKAMMHENNEQDFLLEDMGAFSKLYTDKAIDYLRNRRDEDKPFILYMAHTMLHSIVGVSDKFVGSSNGGLYGDAVEELDYETGRLLDVLDELSLRENTLIIYTTDNGPWAQPNYQKMVANRYPEGAIFWGDLGGLRDGKGSAYEGGSRVPCFINWAGHVPEGISKDGLMATIDFVPTLAALCGFELRDDVIIDGVDQSKFIFTKSRKSARKSFCYMHVPYVGKNLLTDFVAIRDKRWKLLTKDRAVEKHPFLTDFGTNDYELYDLKNDRSESNNLITKHPKIAKRLKLMHSQMRESFENEQ